MEAQPARTFDERAETGAGAMLVAYRLAGLSALEAHYAGGNALMQTRMRHAGRGEPNRWRGDMLTAPLAPERWSVLPPEISA
jgi:hypothetical protein